MVGGGGGGEMGETAERRRLAALVGVVEVDEWLAVERDRRQRRMEADDGDEDVDDGLPEPQLRQRHLLYPIEWRRPDHTGWREVGGGNNNERSRTGSSDAVQVVVFR